MHRAAQPPSEICWVKSEDLPAYGANSGWSVPTLTERIRSSLLGMRSDRAINWPLARRVGLVAPDDKPVRDRLLELTREEGFEDVEALRRSLPIPGRPLFIREIRDGAEGLPSLGVDAPRLVLEHAVILGLCGANHFLPDKPVIWTEARLRRRVELYEIEWEEFYGLQ